MPGTSIEDVMAFRASVLDLYAREGRNFAWRRTTEPWAILVSEVMLQQTQTDRVSPKYEAWMARFPDAASVAAAGLPELYESWRGLGYNSRALRLREAARICASRYSGQPPADENLLLELPGVGRYTARAVLAFAYGLPTVFLETNIRAALIFSFFPGKENIDDRELEQTAALVLDRDDPRTWYQALMDYGAWIKRREPNPSRRAAGYSRQARFEGSTRQARGAVLRAIADSGRLDLRLFAAESGIDYGRLRTAALGLERDGLVKASGDQVGFTE